MAVQKLNRGAILSEIPHISIDKFEFQSEACATAFFLTHYDDDTLNELLNGDFISELEDASNAHGLYLHQIVFSLLKYWTTTHHYDNEAVDGEEMATKLDQLLQDGKIVLLNINMPIELKSDNKSQSLTITPLSSGSDAGCVMLLMETTTQRVLYTGACRLTVNDLQACPALHNGDGSVKSIDKLYLDTTYCLEDVKELPARSSVVKQLAKQVVKQIEVDDAKQFEFMTSRDSKISNLFAVSQMAKLTDQEIHVPLELAELFSSLNTSQALNISSETNSTTRIHFDCADSCDNEECSPNHRSDFQNAYDISPISLECEMSCKLGSGIQSTNALTLDQIEWTKNKTYLYTTKKSQTESYHGIYSNHLSFNEMGRLLKYFHVEPTNVRPLFLRDDMSTDDIELGLEYACDAKSEPTEIATELPSTWFDFTN